MWAGARPDLLYEELAVGQPEVGRGRVWAGSWPDLLYEQLAVGQLLLALRQLLVGVGLEELELRAARQQRLHLRAHLADEEPRVRELVLRLVAHSDLMTKTHDVTATLIAAADEKKY